jgi:hypothetical protein
MDKDELKKEQKSLHIAVLSSVWENNQLSIENGK